jgi:GrpB-like predicted nucleotidyltransferase (UPF0157 family)
VTSTDPDEQPRRSDEELQRILIDPPTPHNAPIYLADSDPNWPALFDREAMQIRAILGRTAIQIEHAGSTSVPGLPAKPIIDIVLAVPDSADEPSYVPAMEAAGYVLRIREPDWFEHRLFKGPGTNINLHVFSVGASEIDRMLLFRDWLRAHPADRDAYLQVKRELAQQTWRHVQHYADAKTTIVEQIVARAQLARTRPVSPTSHRPVTPD